MLTSAYPLGRDCRKTREACSWCADKEEVFVLSVSNDLFCYSTLLKKIELDFFLFAFQLRVSLVLRITLTSRNVGISMEVHPSSC